MRSDMAASQRVVQAVEAAIIASAHLTALQHVSAAADACDRLGRRTTGRWRAAARELAQLEDDLQMAFISASETLGSRAKQADVPERTLWSVGDAAGTLDLLREAALGYLDQDDTLAAGILRGQVLFGVSFVEDEELPDRGTTLLFAWPEPLAPASWPWQANWVVGDTQDLADGEDDEDEDAEVEGEELDLFETGELEGDEPLLAAFAEELSCSPEQARAALRSAAMAVTRASLLSGLDDEDEDEDEDDST